MNPYPEYKETNLPWLPRIPKHWEVKKIKYILSERREVSNTGTEQLLCLSQYSGITPKNTLVGRFSESLIGYRIVKRNDIVMNIMLAWNGSTAMSAYEGVVSPAYAVFYSKGNANPRFLHYLFKIQQVMQYFKAHSSGVIESRLRLYPDEFAKLSAILPSPAEQAQIVRYLDAMTAKINRLIRAKKKEIALLQEQKQAIINQAVTKGLNPNAEMKDSGIDWIGKIPIEWSVCRCRYLFKETNNRSEDGHEVHLSMSQKYGLIPDEQLEGHHLLSESYEGGKVCEKNDLVLNRLKAHLGVFSLAPQQGVVSPDYTILQINQDRIIPLYAEYILKSTNCRPELRLRVRGIVEGFWRLYTDDFNTITLPLPPIEEQIEILKDIEAKTETSNKVINNLECEIANLKEYQSTLISSVVTGAVDVRGITVEEVKVEEGAEIVEEGDEIIKEEEEFPNE